ncbi:methionyl-tRNA formyltransferase [Myxococcota bacterium]|nr:methionyl-tRNA formyltransferase [Myxococcota bacterium]MCZ7620525.1 methionyl-tRNA formyltransferase [Myxococcota bacterium]
MGRRIVVFGQAAFARDVLVRLLDAGHTIVGVYAPPEGGRPEPLADEAAARGLPLFRYKAFRRRSGGAIGERVAEYLSLGAELNVMPYTTVILPPEIVEAPPLGSLCFHPSLLPEYRGGAAIPWQILLGARETGVTVFQPDAGVDTGPIVVQKGGVEIADTDNAATLYFQKLYPLGVEAILEAVDAVDRGTARPRRQDESKASFQGLVTDDVAHVDWGRAADDLGRLVRGCDPSPGAWCERASGERVRLFDARVASAGASEAPGTVVGFEDGRLRVAARGGDLSIGKLRVGAGAKLAASSAGLEIGERLR